MRLKHKSVQMGNDDSKLNGVGKSTRIQWDWNANVYAQSELFLMCRDANVILVNRCVSLETNITANLNVRGCIFIRK